jgi:hypothetical protein
VSPKQNLAPVNLLDLRRAAAPVTLSSVKLFRRLERACCAKYVRCQFPRYSAVGIILGPKIAARSSAGPSDIDMLIWDPPVCHQPPVAHEPFDEPVYAIPIPTGDSSLMDRKVVRQGRRGVRSLVRGSGRRLSRKPRLGERRGSGVDRVGGECGAVEDDAVAGAVGRGEPAVRVLPNLRDQPRRDLGRPGARDRDPGLQGLPRRRRRPRPRRLLGAVGDP